MDDPTPAAIGRLAHARALKELANALRENRAATASGLWGSSVAAVTAAVENELHLPLLLICGPIDEADALADDLELFHHRGLNSLPALELSGSLGQVSEEQASNRLQLLARLATTKPNRPPLIVSPIQSLMQSVPSLDQLNQLLWTIRTGQSLEPEKLIVWLSEHGYNRLDQVEVPGDFAVRGGIIDIYLPGEHEESGDQVGLTVRIDFFGDTVESIKHFDLDSLGSKKSLESIRLIDLKGILPETGDSTHFFSYLPPETIVILWAPLEIAEQAKSYFDRFSELLDQDAPGLRQKLDLPIGYLHRGFVYEESARPIAVLGHHELFHRYEQRRRVKKVIASRPVDSFLDLKVGDYVVHVAHGIAKFMGMHTIAKQGKNEEYLSLRFAENATLHVPASRINLIQKYIGGFHGHPQLSRLGSGAWGRQKARGSEAVMDMAAELRDVQAARAAEQGLPHPPATEWEREFEAACPREPTPETGTAAEEIKQDMSRPRPMDRLLCGDVGYGKTELAMRAAFKAVEYGKQVAILVPTTVLAEQH